MSDLNLSHTFDLTPGYEFDRAYQRWLKNIPAYHNTRYFHTLSEENADFLPKQIKKQFHNFCRMLNGTDYLSAAVLFVYHTLCSNDDYDLEQLQNALNEIPVGENTDQPCTLAQLCGDFFLGVHEKEALLFHDTNYFRHLSADTLYHQDPNFLKKHSSPCSRTRSSYLPEFLAQRLYGYPLSVQNLSREDIDTLAQILIQKHCSDLDAENQRREELNTAHQKREEEIKETYGADYHLLRLAKLELDDYRIGCSLPGGLLPLFQACEAAEQYDLCLYILEQYVFPFFACVPWEQGSSDQKIRLMITILETYTDFLVQICRSRCHVMKEYPTVQTFRMDHIESALEEGHSLLGKRAPLGLALAETLRRGKELLSTQMTPDSYSFLTALTPYILLCAGDAQSAAAFLAEHYSEISFPDRQRLYVQLTLMECIRSTEDPEYAAVLYNHFQSELTSLPIQCNMMARLSSDMARYIMDVKQYLLDTNEYTLDQRISWHDLVFSDGRLEKLAEQIENRDGRLPSQIQFSELRSCVDALSRTGGISLPLLNLPNYDRDDKLRNALSQALIRRGRSYCRQSEDYRHLYNMLAMADTRQELACLFQSMILDKAAREIRKIKERSHGSTEEKLKEIDRICRGLSGNLGNEAQLALAQENIDQSCSSFCRACGLTRQELYNRLPEETAEHVFGSILTSELAYQCLISQDNSSSVSLDFTASLAPLTKATEMVLTHIFRRIPNECFSIHETTPSKLKKTLRDYYLDRNENKLEKITFAPCVYLFKTDLFNRWKDQNIVDLSRLRKMEGKKILVDVKKKDQDTVAEERTFGSCDKDNRTLLIQGLDYVRDHHRNLAAHSKPVSKAKTDECRDILLQTRDLLWILLYILNPPNGFSAQET